MKYFHWFYLNEIIFLIHIFITSWVISVHPHTRGEMDSFGSPIGYFYK